MNYMTKIGRADVQYAWISERFEASSKQQPPIFIAGERQLHMMQPVESSRMPKNANEWFVEIERNGQIVISLEALDLFVDALRKIQTEMVGGHTWVSRVFNDLPRYCRAPVYLAGGGQIYLTQPFEENEKMPVSVKGWLRKSKKHGQIIISLDVLDAFVNALRKIRTEMILINW